MTSCLLAQRETALLYDLDSSFIAVFISFPLPDYEWALDGQPLVPTSLLKGIVVLDLESGREQGTAK